MKNLRLLLILSITMFSIGSLAVRGNNTVCDHRPVTGTIYDDIQPGTWYLIDTISTNRITLVRDSAGLFYAFSDNVDINAVDTHDMISNDNSYIVLTCFCRKNNGLDLLIDNEFLKQAFDTPLVTDEIILSNAYDTLLENGLRELYVKNKVKYYIFCLVKGKIIEKYTTIPLLDFRIKPVIACCDQAFYKVLIPVFRDWRYRKQK